MSWTEDDPGQGSPDGLLALAADLQADADDAAAAARMLRGVQHNASDAVWKGTSANAFRDRVDKLPGHLDKLNASYADAAAGIRSYAASVRQIADDARVQQQAVSQSTGDLQSAQIQQAAWTPPPHPATGQPDPAAKNPHDDQVAAANASLKKAQAQLHDLAGQRKTADGKLVSALNHAHGEGMQNKHWWQKALDFVSDALSKITIILMVVALVAIVVLAIVQPELIPGLLLLAGQVLTALSATQLAVDGARKASGENVAWGTLGMEALGALPGVGLLGDGLKGGQFAERAATTLGRAGGFLRDSAAGVRGGSRAVTESYTVAADGERLVSTAGSATEQRTLQLYYKKTWTAEQRAAADTKVGQLNAHELTKTPVTRTPGVRGRYAQYNGVDKSALPKDMDVDHLHDLQLGGQDALSNTQLLDRSVNRSFGAQIRNRTADDQFGTQYHHVTIIDRP